MTDDDVGFHTFPIERADTLEDPGRYRFCSREELLELLNFESDAVVADLGSGTGFYTREVAPFVDTIYAVDVQSAMHDKFRQRDSPANVEFVTAGISSLPFADGHLDSAFSTMTHHEYADPRSFAELARVIRPGGTLVTVDWSADGDGADGPPLTERYGATDASAQLEAAGFELESVRMRPETFILVARRPEPTD